jgi:hypothetical protein
MLALLQLSYCSGACIGKDPSDGMWEWAWRERTPSRRPKIPLSAVSASWRSGRFSASIDAGPQHYTVLH